MPQTLGTAQNQLGLFGPPGGKAAKTLVFDLETQNSFDDVGGRGKTSALKMSVGVTYDPDEKKFHVYHEKDVGDMIDALFAAGMVVGFNQKNFDYKVLEPYTSRTFDKIKSLDILEDLYKALGHRIKLDSVAQATLSTQKSGHGLEAIEWFRKGEMEKLIKYCQDDVKITCDIYLHGKKHGYVYIPSWGEKKKVKVDW